MNSLISITVFVCCMLSCCCMVQANEWVHEINEEHNGSVEYIVTSEAWFDLTIKDTKDSNEVIRKGRIVIGLFGDICPMTSTNFVQLTKGFKREGVSVLLYDYFFTKNY